MFKSSTSRDIIHDTQASSVNIERRQEDIWGWIDHFENKVDGGNFVYITDTDYKNLFAAFSKLMADIKRSNDQKPVGFHFNGREYSFVDDERCRINTSTNGSLRIELIMVRGGDKKQKLIHVTYSMYKHNNAGYVLAFIGNPTTIIAGNNIRPVRSSTSAYKESLMFYKLGILLPEFIFAAEKKPFQWSSLTKRAIQRGQIKVSNTQWAVYLPSENKKIDLGLLAGLYCARLMQRVDSVSLGEHLGFHSTSTMRNKRNGRLSGVFLTRKKGANHVLTINFYDKAESVLNKKQGKTLSQMEMKTINNAIRLDITAHASYLTSIIKAAKKHAQLLIDIKPEIATKLKVFLGDSKDENITAYKVCRAMSILAIDIKDGEFIKRGFTPWLVQRILDDELRLMSILRKCHEAIDIENVSDPKYKKFLNYWKMHYYQESSEFVDAAVADLKLKKTQIYATRNAIYKDTGIDVFIPYDYWRDLAAASAVYGMSEEDKDMFYKIRMGIVTDQKVIGKTIQKLFASANKKIKKTSVQMLASLQVSAKQIEAEEITALE